MYLCHVYICIDCVLCGLCDNALLVFCWHYLWCVMHFYVFYVYVCNVAYVLLCSMCMCFICVCVLCVCVLGFVFL